MKLYPLPGGTWAGTEADWKKAMKAKGLNPKDFSTPSREVPTGKKELMEFLTFFAVDVYRTGDATPAPAVDVEALRALHNPGAGPRPSDLTEKPTAALEAAPTGSLEEMFEAAPIRKQAGIVVAFIDRLVP